MAVSAHVAALAQAAGLAITGGSSRATRSEERQSVRDMLAAPADDMSEDEEGMDFIENAITSGPMMA